MESTAHLGLDSGTLFFATAVLALFMAAVSFSMARGGLRNQSGLAEWGVAMSFAGTAYLLYFLRGHVPWVLAHFGANVLISLAFPAAIVAYARMFQIPIPRRFIGMILAFGLSGMVGHYFLNASSNIAIFTLSLALSIDFALIAFMIYMNRLKTTNTLAWISLSSMAISAVIFAGRALQGLFGDALALAPNSNSVQLVVAMIAALLFIAISTLCLIAMVDERQHREVSDRLRRDGLTGLLTRTAFHEMTAEIDRPGLLRGYAVVLFDIDHFKAVNDTFGHGGGDATLAYAARLIANLTRISDIAVRYGGEEFCVLLKSCTEREAAQFAERVVQEASRQSVRLADGRTVNFTLSAGYACKEQQETSTRSDIKLSDVIDMADRALYRAKNGGRNQAVSAGELQVSVAVVA